MKIGKPVPRASIPSRNLGGRRSKYDEIIDAALKLEPGEALPVLFESESRATSAAVCLTRKSKGRLVITRRGQRVYITTVTVAQIKASKPKARKS